LLERLAKLRFAEPEVINRPFSVCEKTALVAMLNTIRKTNFKIFIMRSFWGLKHSKFIKQKAENQIKWLFILPKHTEKTRLRQLFLPKNYIYTLALKL
jgi:hypothetical protein